MTGEVTRGGGLPGLSGKITLSVGVTICHVNGSGGGGGSLSWKKSSKAKRMF